RGTSYGATVDFVDNDNNWTATEHNNAAFDNAAFDAHMGAQATQDYWTSFHGRDSYDNRGTALTSYVHYGSRYENAFWNGSVMTYGDGDTFFQPLTSIDVCGHEIGHAICETTAALIYQGEAGAMNEGFSDIWGACVEHHFDPAKQIWLIGEDITITMPFLRSMSNPNGGGQPDTYFGLRWYSGPNDFGGVHTNSGVLNYWFYLLSVGGSGTNDLGVAYNVPAITIEKAGRIAYRAESVYLTSTSVYTDGRQATLQAAVDLYGLGSAEVTAVAQAWRAVGLNGGAPTLTAMTPTSGPAGTLVTLTGANLGTVYQVTFNGTPATVATVTSAGTITVMVPPGATTGRVVVTTTQGTATSAGVFTVTGTGAAPTVLSFSPTGGAPQGATVTITGTNLTGATAVTFNGTTAVFSVVSATVLTATVPATATSGSLAVTTPGGGATAPGIFRVLPTLTALAPASGPVGTTVTLTGTSLTGALDVKFNGTYAPFTVTSATSITATVPPGATTGNVTVRTPDGSARSAFTVTSSINLASFAPQSGPVLTTRVDILGDGFTGATVVTFNGTPATYTVASDNEIWATVPAGATTGPIRVTSPLGTSTSALPFVVLTPGAPAITDFSPPAGVVGQSININGTNLERATAVSFNGTPGVVTASTSTRVTATVPTGATTGRVTVITPAGTATSLIDFLVVQSLANDFCSAPNLPVLTCGAVISGTTYGATSAGDPATGCNLTVSSGGVFYRFTGTGDRVSFSTCARRSSGFDTQLHVFSGACGSLTCAGGSDDVCGVASEVTLTTLAGTDYLIFVSGKNLNQGDFRLSATCPEAPTITSFSPTTGAPGTLVTISGTNLTISTAPRFNNRVASSYTILSATQVLARVPFNATTGPITVVANGLTVASAESFVVVRPTLTSFTPTSGPVGTVVTITGTNLAEVTAVTFSGLAATSFQVNATGTELTATVPPGAGADQIKVFMGAGSILASDSFCTEYAATAADSARCGDGPVQLSASGAPATGPAANRYAWYTTATGGTPIAGATGATYITPSLTATTTYYVAVSPAVGCAGPSVPVTATIRPLAPAPVITQSALPSGIVLLVSSAATGNQWYFNGTAIVGAIALTYAVTTAAQSGSYTVQSIVGGCASALSTPVAILVTGTAAELAVATWLLWPNPAQQTVQLSGAPARTELEMFDATGRLVRAAQTDAAGAVQLNLAGLPRGLYVVRIGRQLKRLVVE
ncbi:MAG: IPT/TIG domain-containing protein, partial [Hymenobacteraceae bacterium]|nr:IPT/TIG domain-containing protein [Hymenobacteraceae bacterium]